MYSFENYTANKQALMAGMDRTQIKILELERFGIDVSEPLKKIENAKKILLNDTISIVLVGAFSDGKTSVIAGWLNEHVDNMKIDSDESSDEILCYEPSSIPQGCHIVDTPGLFGDKVGSDEDGGEIKLSEKTKKYISEANMILYVVPAKNPIKDSHKEFIGKLLKDMNKLSTTIFVVNRMDDVADLTDEEDFALQERIKTENVRNKLLSCGLTEAEAQQVKVACISAAPGGKGIEVWRDYRDEYLRRSHLPTLERVTNEVLQQSRRHLLAKTGCDILNDEIHKLLTAVHEQVGRVSETLPILKETFARNQMDLAQMEKQLLGSRVEIREELRVLEQKKLSAIRATTLESFRDVLEDEIGILPDRFGYRLNDDINAIFEKYCHRYAEWTGRLQGSFQMEFEKQNELVESIVSKGASALRGAGAIGVAGFKKGIFTGRDWLSKVGPTIKFKPWQVTKMANFASKTLPVIGAGIALVSDISKAVKARKLNREFESNKDELKKNLMELFKSANDALNDDRLFISSFAPNYEALAQQIHDGAALITEQEDLLIEFANWEHSLSASDLKVS